MINNRLVEVQYKKGGYLSVKALTDYMVKVSKVRDRTTLCRSGRAISFMFKRWRYIEVVSPTAVLITEPSITQRWYMQQRRDAEAWYELDEERRIGKEVDDARCG